jgi:hypothetical protein
LHGHEVYPSDIPSLAYPSGIPAPAPAAPVTGGPVTPTA